MVYGFSTGSLAKGDFRTGIAMVNGVKVDAIELSALRCSELPNLINELDKLSLARFRYISVHAPSKFESLNEPDVLGLLKPIFARGWNVVVHPDVINDWNLWDQFGAQVCIENMDVRKPIGRNADELKVIFDRLPKASLCFDVGHVRQVDPTMYEARRILSHFGNRIRQVHVSTVTTRSRHERLSFLSMLAYREIAHLIPSNAAIILESPLAADELADELRLVEETINASSNEPVGEGF